MGGGAGEELANKVCLISKRTHLWQKIITKSINPLNKLTFFRVNRILI